MNNVNNEVKSFIVNNVNNDTSHMCIPAEVRDNHNIGVYSVYGGTALVARWRRAEHPADTREEVEGVSRPVYYGEWQAVPQAEIDEHNAKHKTFRICGKQFEFDKEQTEREIEYAMELLKKKYEMEAYNANKK